VTELPSVDQVPLQVQVAVLRGVKYQSATVPPPSKLMEHFGLGAEVQTVNWVLVTLLVILRPNKLVL